MSREPAAARVKELEDELSRAHATTPALAEAAAQSEAQGLRQALAASQAELASVRASLPAARGAPAAAAGGLPPNPGVMPLPAVRRSRSDSGSDTPRWRAASGGNSAASRFISVPKRATLHIGIALTYRPPG